MDNAVTVSLYGGLGNQLFQYAAARALATRRDVPLVLDLTWFDQVTSLTSVTVRKYALGPFDLSSKFLCSGLGATGSLGIFPEFFKRVRRKLGFPEVRRQYSESSFRFDANVLRLATPVWLNGYWQSPKYFDDASDLVRREIGTVRVLSPKSQILYDQIRGMDAVCIHVRRGDYVTNKDAAQLHGLCSQEYYRKGVEIAVSNLYSPHCYVFSDDPDWVKDNFDVGMGFTVVDVNGPEDAHQDLWLMSACKNFVIANSSLSWWGAWLGASGGKKVVCPGRWFANDSIDTSDLFPDDWIRI